MARVQHLPALLMLLNSVPDCAPCDLLVLQGSEIHFLIVESQRIGAINLFKRKSKGIAM
jgi:hypothetical protein